MFNKVILIGRFGQNAEAKTAQNNREFVILHIATRKAGRTTRASERRASQSQSS
jgi:single-strand DNA-binding protein